MVFTKVFIVIREKFNHQEVWKNDYVWQLIWIVQYYQTQLTSHRSSFEKNSPGGPSNSNGARKHLTQYGWLLHFMKVHNKFVARKIYIILHTHLFTNLSWKLLYIWPIFINNNIIIELGKKTNEHVCLKSNLVV